jgi:hypothetical protein
MPALVASRWRAMPDEQPMTMNNTAWIQTFTGRRVWPLRVQVSDINIEDIAHSLSMQCRFTGHVKAFYSIAQHSTLVSQHCAPADAMWGLLHDASEYVLHDLPRPLKRHPDFAFYRSAEEDCMRAICDAFRLPHEMPASVEETDARMLATEARDLMSPIHPDWKDLREPYPMLRISSWSPRFAKHEFVDRFFALEAQRG